MMLSGKRKAEFGALGLSEDILRALSERGYVEPTPIQRQLIPLILEGRDVIGLSETGSGKTAAFVLPLLDGFVREGRRAKGGHCSVLVLSPTRELSSQIGDAVRDYGKYVRYAQAIIVGGVSYAPQERSLKRGADIVIATPGRILDHIEKGAVVLDDTGVIVLDEADQMLDFGFLPAIREILGKLPATRQSLLLSATMPKAVRDLARDFMTGPALISATPESRPVETVDQSVLYIEGSRKKMALLEIIARRDVERAIIFTRTKFGAERVARFLGDYGISAMSLHGNKSQGQRSRALGAFRSGDASVLVATDIAGRGIDIDDVSHVINFDMPRIAESYVHRIGRTARAGRRGVAISFCSEAERVFLKEIEKLIGTSLPKRHDSGEDQARDKVKQEHKQKQKKNRGKRPSKKRRHFAGAAEQGLKRKKKR